MRHDVYVGTFHCSSMARSRPRLFRRYDSRRERCRLLNLAMKSYYRGSGGRKEKRS